MKKREKAVAKHRPRPGLGVFSQKTSRFLATVRLYLGKASGHCCRQKRSSTVATQ